MIETKWGMNLLLDQDVHAKFTYRKGKEMFKKRS